MFAFNGYFIGFSIISIMLIIAGIILGLGIALNEKTLKEFGKSELFQSLINGAILSSLFFIFSKGGLITSMINNIVLKTSTSLSCPGFESTNYAICFAYNFLTGLNGFAINGVHFLSLFNEVSVMLLSISSIYVIIALIASLKFNFIIGISLSTVFTPLLSVLNHVLTSLVFSLLSIEVQAYLLKFAGIVSISILLPIGIILRTFYFTRRLGGTIIAISIGFFCIFPLTYLLNAQLIYSYSSDTFLLNNLLQNTSQLKSNVLNQTSLTSNSIPLQFITTLNTNITNFLNYFWNKINKIISELALIIIEIFFLPVLSLILTMVSIREFAKILGTEISFGKFDLF